MVKKKATKKKATKRKVGRPTKYTQKLADDICEWIASGKSLRAYCRHNTKIHISTITKWIVGKPEFFAQYAQAREAAGYAHGDAVIEIAELLRDGDMDHQTAKAIMDGLKWAAERMAPKSHSPKQIQEHTGPGGAPLGMKVEFIE